MQGQSILERPAIHQVDLCHYQGYLKAQKTTTWAAISTCNSTFHGMIHDGKELWHLHSQGSHLYLYQHSAQSDQNYTCGYQDPFTSGTNAKEKTYDHHQRLFKRDISKATKESVGGGLLNNGLHYQGVDDLDDVMKKEQQQQPKSKLRGPWNANKRSRYVELVLVVDHQEFLEHNSDLELVYR